MTLRAHHQDYQGNSFWRGPGKSSQNLSAVGAGPHTPLQSIAYLDKCKHLPPAVKTFIDKNQFKHGAMHFDRFNLQHRPDMVLKGWSMSARAAECLTRLALCSIAFLSPSPLCPSEKITCPKIRDSALCHEHEACGQVRWAAHIAGFPAISFIPTPGMSGWAAGLQHKYLHLKNSCLRRSHLVFSLPVLLLASSWKVVKKNFPL